MGMVCSLMLALAACSVYEPPEGHDGDDGHDDHGEGETIELSDTCSAEDILIIESSDDHYITSVEDLNDSFSGFPACGYEGMLDGPDGFVRLVAAAGERWHVEVEPEDEDLDVAIYMLPTCDALSCELLVDRCRGGFAEDFTFVAETAGDYFIGIDTAAGAGELELLVLRTQCGDALVEHGESCDDGNLQDGDGCDWNCRIEMEDIADSEVEPNNWHTSANVIRFAGPGTGTTRISGSLGGPCDTDHYAIEVPPGASVYAAMFDGGEQACGLGHAAVDMMFMDGRTGNQRGKGNAGGVAGGCPSLERGRGFNEALAGGEYHLVVTAQGEAPVFDYVLEFEIEHPGQGAN